jgi:hypothetical protein
MRYSLSVTITPTTLRYYGSPAVDRYQEWFRGKGEP